jgi:hypothetical protein
MKLKQPVIILSVLAMLGAAPLQAAGKGGNRLQSPAVPQLSVEEEGHLLYMREEEKLARDVYLNAYESWGQPIFDNISLAEQKHMNAIADRIDYYGLEYPVTDDAVGEFDNPDLAGLYEDLNADASESLKDALYVGAYIEEVDILDLLTAIEETTHPDIIRVYENLLRGSRNHLRAFVRQIEAMGKPYVAKEMDQDEVNAIVDTPMERGGRVRKGRQAR